MIFIVLTAHPGAYHSSALAFRDFLEGHGSSFMFWGLALSQKSISK